MSKILHCVSLKAPYSYEFPEIVEYTQKHWFSTFEERLGRKARKIFEGAKINGRNGAVPIETVFSGLSFQEKNDLFREASIDLGTKAVEKILNQSNIAADEIDFFISVSCTGFMIPSVDAYVIEKLNFKEDVIRMPITEMGCAGGTSALIYANELVKANPDKKVLILSVETPTLTLQEENHSLANIVSAAIFGDGAVATIVGNDDSVIAPKIIDTQMYHFKDAAYLMGFNLENTGLKIVLDKDIPSTIEKNFSNFFNPFLEKNNLSPDLIDHYLFHPGGKKIVSMVENLLKEYGKGVPESKQVLEEYGNMSSATILHILETFMNRDIKKGDKGYMLAFGPGFSAQSLLIEWT